MQDWSQILNIEAHTKRLVVKALNVHATKKAAAMALGVPEKTLFNKMEQYDIVKTELGYISQRPIHIIQLITI